MGSEDEIVGSDLLTLQACNGQTARPIGSGPDRQGAVLLEYVPPQGEPQSMLISESHQFIFLAVPKTGSSSIEKALAPYRATLTDEFKKHATCSKLKRELPTGIWESYFKFAFVRNPYDFMQSWYFYRQRDELADPKHPRHHLYTGDTSFEEFITTFARKEWLLPQVEWVAPAAMELQVQLDYVGRYETFEDDFRQICRRLAIPYPTLPRLRRSRNDAGASKLWNSRTRAVVNDYFWQDFKAFGYEVLR
jgi:hypothetical protein